MSDTTTAPAERKHHPFSPSSLNYIEASPCFQNRQEAASEKSKRGTAQHDAVDRDDMTGLEDAEAEAVASCMQYFQALVDKYPGGKVINEEYLPIDDEVMVTQEEWLPNPEAEPVLRNRNWTGTSAGYLDRSVISFDETEAEICDWKFGAWSVPDAKTNLQGITYLLGVFKRYPKLQKVTVHFVMPHRDEITVHTFTRDDFPALYTRVVTVVRRAEEHRKDIAARGVEALKNCTPTTGTCVFCAHVGKCPLATEIALKIGKKFAPILIPDNADPMLFSDPAQARLAMDLAGFIQAWAKGTRSEITNRAIENLDWMPEGYQLRQRADTEIKNPERAIEEAIAWGAPEEKLDEAWELGVTKLMTAVRAGAERGSKESREAEFRKYLLGLGITEKNAPTVFLEKEKA